MYVTSPEVISLVIGLLQSRRDSKRVNCATRFWYPEHRRAQLSPAHTGGRNNSSEKCIKAAAVWWGALPAAKMIHSEYKLRRFKETKVDTGVRYQR